MPAGRKRVPTPPVDAHRLFDNPPDVAIWRRRLFELAEPVELSMESFEMYWPYVDNFYSRKDVGKLNRDGQRRQDSYRCRFWRKDAHKQVSKFSGGSTKPVSQKYACGVRVRVEYFFEGGEVVRVVVSRYDDSAGHEGHDIEQMDLFKRNSKVRTTIAGEAAKGYASASIKKQILAVDNPEARAEAVAAGAEWVDLYDTVNARRPYARKFPNHYIISNLDAVEQQVEELYTHLAADPEYSVRRLSVRRPDGIDSRAIVWLKKSRKDVLMRCGRWLSMMDATHNTNRLKWYLFTVMVRDGHGAYRPCAFFFSEFQDGHVISSCLKVIREWCGGRGGWNPRYFLTDDSAAEQAACRKAFPGPPVTTEVVQHLLCHRHFLQNLRERFKGDTYRETMKHLYAATQVRQTEPGCRESLSRAIKALPKKDRDLHAQALKRRDTARRRAEDARRKTGKAPRVEEMSEDEDSDVNPVTTKLRDNKAYIEKLADRIPLWAQCKREHSMLLIQIRTTNPVESWHKVLKYSVGKQQIVHFSLLGATLHVETRASVYDQDARAKELNFRAQRHPLAANDLRWIRQLPYPVQKLIAGEYLEAKLKWDAGDNSYHREMGDSVSCSCFFWRSYNLPCRHIFTQNFVFGNLLQDDYNRWLLMWEDCGFELYEGNSASYIEEGIDDDPFAPERHRDRMKEAIESLTHCYYHTESRLREQYKDNPERFDVQMSNFVDGFNMAVGKVWQKALSDFIKSTAPVGIQVDSKGDDNSTKAIVEVSDDDGEDMYNRTILERELAELAVNDDALEALLNKPPSVDDSEASYEGKL